MNNCTIFSTVFSPFEIDLDNLIHDLETLKKTSFKVIVGQVIFESIFSLFVVQLQGKCLWVFWLLWDILQNKRSGGLYKHLLFVNEEANPEC